MKDKVFTVLAKHFSSFTKYCWLPISAKYLSETVELPYRKCLELLHQLRDEGVVKVERVRFYDDYTEEYYFASGWVITDFGKQTEIYKNEEKNTNDYLDSLYNDELGGM